ncbi:MAG: GGDEF domain-containing protein [Magnetococcales bacterium]|nr:GGDEF domain-containing protein [Magnetococcales bacterium]
MWRDKSLKIPAVSFLLVAVIATLGVGYLINFTILKDVLQERMHVRAGQITEGVRADLSSRVSKLEHFKDSWSENTEYLLDLEADNGVEGLGLKEMVRQWQDLFPLWNLEFLLILDHQGQTLQHLPVSFDASEPLSGELLQNARKALSKGHHYWSSAKVGGAWSLLLFAPLKVEGHPSLTVVFAQQMEALAAEVRAANPAHPFQLAAGDGLIGDNLLDVQPDSRLQLMIDGVIESDVAHMEYDADRQTNLFVTPLPIFDRSFALVVPVEVEQARQILAGSRERLAYSGIFIVLLLVGVGFALDRLILAPLKRLRNQAAAMVKACSGNEQKLYIDPEESGNEIALLEKAFEEASVKLYAHVSHLIDAKQLLEGLALQDPVTLLGNRRMFHEFLARTLGQCRRKERKVAVLLIEPTSLTERGSSSDEVERDLMLRAMADRLRHHLRGEDLAFRVDHNMFVSFAPECGDEEQVLALTNRLYQFLVAPYTLEGGKKVVLGLHIGISLFPESGEEVTDLLEASGRALDLAKREGGVPFRIYQHPEATTERGE